MEALLRNDFTAHYGLPVPANANISANTNATYFELKDDNTLVYTTAGQGIAKYSNPNTISINVINFETFFNLLRPSFIKGKNVCDLIVHDNNQQYILFNELTDTLPKYVDPFPNTSGPQPGKRQKAINQLLSTLSVVMQVPSINAFANAHTIKHCCFFNKQPVSPPGITATTAFNRLGTLSTSGLSMQNPAIAAFGFQLWEYSGSQVYTL